MGWPFRKLPGLRHLHLRVSHLPVLRHSGVQRRADRPTVPLLGQLYVQDFTQMSAGQPRPTQKERFRQRFMHKLVYFPDNNDGLFAAWAAAAA